MDTITTISVSSSMGDLQNHSETHSLTYSSSGESLNLDDISLKDDTMAYPCAQSTHMCLCPDGSVDIDTYEDQSDLMTFCDFDANLFHEDMEKDIHYHIQNAQDHHVKYLVVPGTNLIDSQKSLDLASTNSSIICIAGIHPYCAGSEEFSGDNMNTLRRMITNEFCNGVGECGLDYSSHCSSSKDDQISWFRFQISLAIEYDLPLFLHVRHAYDDFVDILSDFGFYPHRSPPTNGIVHCFTGNMEELRFYLSLGFMIGITGFIFKLDKEHAIDQLSTITLDRLVIETDAPYMGWNGCRVTERNKTAKRYPCTPAAIPILAQYISSLTGWSVKDIADATLRNSLSILRVR